MSRQWKVPVTEGSVLPVFSVKTQNCYFFPMKYHLTSFKNYKLEKVNYYYEPRYNLVLEIQCKE